MFLKCWRWVCYVVLTCINTMIWSWCGVYLFVAVEHQRSTYQINVFLICHACQGIIYHVESMFKVLYSRMFPMDVMFAGDTSRATPPLFNGTLLYKYFLFPIFIKHAHRTFFFKDRKNCKRCPMISVIETKRHHSLSKLFLRVDVISTRNGQCFLETRFQD